MLKETLSIAFKYQMENQLFESIDPVEARRILDEELYGMERVKQRIIETIIQINRTHTLPAYGHFAGRTGRYREIPDRLRSCTYFKITVDNTGHELHQ